MKPVTVRVKRLRPNASLPRYMTDLAAGMDLHAALDSNVRLDPGERCLIPTGIAMAIPPGFEGQVRPRSGLALKKGITLVNSPGTIDADYRGEIGVVMINHGEEPVTLQPGDRIAQMVIAAVCRAELVAAEELEETGRSAGGFGHTGLEKCTG